VTDQNQAGASAAESRAAAMVHAAGRGDAEGVALGQGPPTQHHLAERQRLFGQYLVVGWVIAGVTLIGFLLQRVLNYHAIALVYLFAVVVLGVFVGRGPVLLAAALSALLWDFFFLEPVETLWIAHFDDAMVLGMYFVVALVLGQLTARIRAQEKEERHGQERATALYVLTRELAEAKGLDDLMERAVSRLGGMFEARVAVVLPEPGHEPGRRSHAAGTLELAERDMEAADWVFRHGQAAGKFTGHLADREALYVPMAVGAGPVGVIALRLSHAFPPTLHQWQMMEAAAQHVAMAYEEHRLQEMLERARLLAESERLSKTLLNSMSHEIRTPIAAITSAVGELQVEPPGASPLSGPQRSMVGEIQEAAERLNRVVGNVLEITRLESGTLKPRTEVCDVNDLVHVAVKETRKQLARHRVTVEGLPGVALAPLDYVLTQQALTNLLSNAAFHTPPGTAVAVGARMEPGWLALWVADRGPGVDAEALPRVFDKFYRGPGAAAGGTGLGLSVVKGLIEAQGGRVTAENQPDGGAVFTIRLPVGEGEGRAPGAAQGGSERH
jgi:two-component system sensor histidine kinase KdpD